MKTPSASRWAFLLVAAAFAPLSAGFPGAIAAGSPSGEREKGTRQLWDEDFTASRPPPAAARPKTPPRRAAAPTRGVSYVGVTVWHLKPGGEGSRGVALTAEGRRWLPERAEADREVPEGQPVRLSIETTRRGYLYVIDREGYADGGDGDPVLVFPTLRIRGGDNAVEPGRVVEIPDLTDQPPYFTLTRSRPDHVEERLLFLVTAEPLPGLEPGREAKALPREQVDEWERRWGARSRRLEAAEGAGKAYTEAEHAAATSPNRLLTRGEPLPQTLYRVEGSPDVPSLITLVLRIAPAR